MCYCNKFNDLTGGGGVVDSYLHHEKDASIDSEVFPHESVVQSSSQV